MAKRSNSATCLDQFKTMVENCRRQVAGIVSPTEAEVTITPTLDISLIFSPSQLLFWRINDSLLPTLHGITKSDYPTTAISILGKEVLSLLDYAAPATGEQFHKAASKTWREFITPLQNYSNPTASKIEADRKRLSAFLTVVKDFKSKRELPVATKKDKGISTEDLAQKIDNLTAELPIAVGVIRAEVQSEGKKTREEIKRSRKSNRTRFSETTQEEAHLIWEKYRRDKDIAPSSRGRKLRYEDVFNHAKAELAALSEPITSAEDFERCLGARSDRIHRSMSKKPQK